MWPLAARETVYDITVPGADCFALANGAVVHNSSHPADMARYAAQGLALLAQPAGLAVVRQPESPWYVR